MLLKAKADPHMKCRVAYGKDSSQGATALSIAEKMGWSDCVSALQKALGEIAPHYYMRYGKLNNTRLEVYKTGVSPGAKNPFDEMHRADYVPGQVLEDEEPRTSVGLLFPGQGSQYVKMMIGVADIVEVKEMV